MSVIELLHEFERYIHRDPARRGLIAAEQDSRGNAVTARLGAGQLAAAAVELAENARRVGLLTGFFIPHGQLACAETDGPPGTVFLAHCLRELDIDVVVITDGPCAPAVRATAERCSLPLECQFVSPLIAADWCEDFLRSETAVGLTHLISVERVGPSHTPESIMRLDPDAASLFLAEVESQHHGHCHNMRGVSIDAHTAPLHLLFDRLPEFCPNTRTIGVGDGGNEIGMGSIPWSELRRRLNGEQAGRVPCRVACDFNIVAGVSNWGAMALAAGVCLLRNRLDVIKPWTQDRHHELIRHLVERGPAVDGVTGQCEPTVDGLPFLTYIQPWEGIRRSLGWDD